MASTDAFGSPSPEPVAAHVVDGWRLGPEYPCPASWGTGCADITRAATKLVQAKYPGAGIVQTHLAPPLCGPYLCTNGGLEQPDFVVLDMADGSRRVVVLLCGQTCSASPFTYPESRAQP